MSRARGNLAEDRACSYLLNNGFNVIERNFYSRFGEIDIIALRDKTLHFIEVKSGPTYEQAIANITPAKLERILKTVAVFLKARKLDLDYMIDALIVSPDSIEMVENITF